MVHLLNYVQDPYEDLTLIFNHSRHYLLFIHHYGIFIDMQFTPGASFIWIVDHYRMIIILLPNPMSPLELHLESWADS